jgi:5-methylcytosine-specific restriction enzyme subunit McrC
MTNTPPIRRLSLREYQTTAAVPLSIEERNALQATIASITVNPTRDADGLFDLTPSSWIGAIELPTISLEIRSKVPLERVFFLISYSLDPRAWRETTFSFATAPSLLEAMIPPFTTAVSKALRRGVLQGYRIEEDALPTVRGRIRFDEQLKRRYGRIPPVELQFDEFTEDIAPNRLIKLALARLSRLRIRNEHSRVALRRFDRALERVQTIEYDPRQLPEINYTRLNAHYRPAVELAKLVIRATSLELGFGVHRGASFLIDMNRVFENFVVAALREALRLGPTAFPQGGRRHPLYLDRERRVRLKPDISWWQDRTCVFVGDVKYKRVQVAEIEHADLYQLLAYTIATALPGGMLIYAADEATPVEHEIPLANKRLQVATLDVRDQPDAILARVARLATEIRRLRNQALAELSPAA